MPSFSSQYFLLVTHRPSLLRGLWKLSLKLDKHRDFSPTSTKRVARWQHWASSLHLDLLRILGHMMEARSSDGYLPSVVLVAFLPGKIHCCQSNVRGSLCFAHIRFRSAIKAQAHRRELAFEDLPYHAILGLTGSWIGFIMCCICILATIYTACNPGGDFDVIGFFQEILALPICLTCYIFWKVWKKPSIIKAAEADLVSGRKELDLKEAKEIERRERATWGRAKQSVPSINQTNFRVYRWLC